MGVQYMICHWAINRTDPQNLLSTTLDVPLHWPCHRTQQNQTLPFMRAQHPSNSSINLSPVGGPLISPKPIWCYLGFYFNHKLNFNYHMHFYTMKCLSTLNTMKILGNSARGLFPIQKRLLYRTCILPIALYGFQLWFFKSASIVKNLAELRKIQQRAALWITKAFCVSQLCYGPVVTYCMVYHYTKRVMLARLLANKGLAIYVVYLNRYFVIPPWYYLVVTFLWHCMLFSEGIKAIAGLIPIALHFQKPNGRCYLWYASIPPYYAINLLLDSQHAKNQPLYRAAISNLKSPIKDINEHLNNVNNYFNSLHPLFFSGSRVVNHFSGRISFYSSSSLSNKDLHIHLQNINQVFHSSQISSHSMAIITDEDIKKSHVAIAVIYIWSDNSVVKQV